MTRTRFVGHHTDEPPSDGDTLLWDDGLGRWVPDVAVHHIIKT